MAGSTNLFLSSISNPLLAVVAVGMRAKASISPLSELAWEAGEEEPVGRLHGRPVEMWMMGFAATPARRGSPSL